MIDRTLCLLSSQRADSCLQDKLWVIQFYLWKAFLPPHFTHLVLSGGFVKPSPRTRIARIDQETRLPFLSSLRSVDRLNFQPPTRKVLLDDEVPCVEVRLKEQGEAEGEGRGESTPPFSSPYSTGSQALNEIHTYPTITAWGNRQWVFSSVLCSP